MKSLINLCSALLADAGSFCSVDTVRDLDTIKSRTQHEGLSFLTITLPDFAESFERALELGRVDSTLFVGWRRRGCLPAFLRGFTSLVFGANGGLLDEPSETAVYCIRQVCRVFKKVKFACSDFREASAFQRYKQTEAVLPETIPETDRLAHFRACCSVLWGEVFGPEFSTFGLVPKHGPGATAEKISGNAKYSHLVWYERLEEAFPVTEHYFTSVNHMLDDNHGLVKLSMVPVQDELPVRVISVPKTLKTPRIIAIEPVCMQYAQQALSRFIVERLQTCNLTRSVIRFDDQTVNQRMALRASSDKSFSTIDLSDASDRIPNRMIEYMLESCPQLLAAVQACRSRSAKLPNGDLVSLKKFASMGSALCFPIESMYFYSIIIHALLWGKESPPSRRDICKIAKRVYVFGDDIIIPKGETDTVIEALTHYYCKVNVSKSFWKGNFRESCGTDAFRGIDVTPIYVREPRPSTRRASARLVSWIATSNLFHKAGCWRTADFMRQSVEKVLGPLPAILDSSPGLGWVSFLGIPDSTRLCKALHRPIVRTYTVRPRYEKDNLNGYPALLKYFLRTEKSTLSAQTSKKHLTLSVRCGTVSRQRRWVPAS